MQTCFESPVGRYSPIPSFIWPLVYIRPEILKSVVFLGTKRDGKFQPRASGFIAMLEQDGNLFGHLVTAEHVVSGLLAKGHQIFVRANLKGGGVRDFPCPPDDWHYYPTERGERQSDVVVAPLAREGQVGREHYELDAYPILMNGNGAISAMEPQIAPDQIGLGDIVFAIGLFRSHYGHQNNIPVIRHGRIAAMPHEPVWTKYAGYMDAYLVEMNSISGLSGSPVFVVLRKGLEQKFWFFGLVHGHFDVQNLNDDVASEDSSSGLGSINTGIGVIIPLEKIMKTIQQKSLADLRTKLVREMKKGAATADLAVDEPPLATGRMSTPTAENNPPNPRHKEDFTSLLDAAAQSPKPSD